MQLTATYCNIKMSYYRSLHIALHRNTLQRTHALQHTVTHCNALQRTAMHRNIKQSYYRSLAQPSKDTRVFASDPAKEEVGKKGGVGGTRHDRRRSNFSQVCVYVCLCLCQCVCLCLCVSMSVSVSVSVYMHVRLHM